MKMISLLRGINVSGQKKIKMVDLKAHYEEWGLSGVETYIQSGNVVFDGAGLSETRVKNTIETGIREAYGFEVPVEVRTAVEWLRVLESWPFRDIDVVSEGSKCCVVFLSEKPDAAKVKELLTRVEAPEELLVDGREIFLWLPNGVGRTKLTTTLIERILRVSATARNWKTVLKLQDMVTS